MTSSHLPEDVEKVKIKKENLIVELYKTELTYLKSLADQKSILSQLLVNQGPNLTDLDKQQIAIWNHLLDSLIARSEEILKKVTVAAAGQTYHAITRGNVGDILKDGPLNVQIQSYDIPASFTAISAKSPAMQQYANYFEQMNEFFMGINTNTKGFLENVAFKKPIDASGFQSLLIAPIQRDPRYMMLLPQILKLESDTAVQKTLEIAFDQTKINTGELNENKRQFENYNANAYVKTYIYQNKMAEYKAKQESIKKENSTNPQNEDKLTKLGEQLAKLGKETRAARVDFDSSMKEWFQNIAKEKDPTQQTIELKKAVSLEFTYLYAKLNNVKDQLDVSDPNQMKIIELCTKLKIINDAIGSHALTSHASNETAGYLKSQMAALNDTLKSMPPNIRVNFKDFNSQFDDCYNAISKPFDAALDISNKATREIVSSCKKMVHIISKEPMPLIDKVLASLGVEIDMYMKLSDRLKTLRESTTDPERLMKYDARLKEYAANIKKLSLAKKGIVNAKGDLNQIEGFLGELKLPSTGLQHGIKLFSDRMGTRSLGVVDMLINQVHETKSAVEKCNTEFGTIIAKCNEIYLKAAPTTCAQLVKSVNDLREATKAVLVGPGNSAELIKKMKDCMVKCDEALNDNKAPCSLDKVKKILSEKLVTFSKPLVEETATVAAQVTSRHTINK